MKRSREETVELPQDFAEKHIDTFVKGCHHILGVDPSLYDALLSKDFQLFLKREQPPMDLNHHFIKLASSILAQQISGAAANSVKNKLMAYYGGHFPTYQAVVETFHKKNVQELRDCGLSARKVQYLESLANYFNDNEKAIEALFEQDNEEIASQLVANIKGIGPWSAKMFLVTSLERMDVFAADDLGIARGCSKYLDCRPEILKELMSKRVQGKTKRSKIVHKKKNWKIYDEDIVEKCGEMFAPYRSIFMFILWRLSSTNIDALAKREKDFVAK